MKDAMIESIRSALAGNPDVFFLTGDLGFMAFEGLFSEFPDRVLNVGVAEANMICVASGLSRMGKRVICYSMIPFVLMRCLEQIRVHLGIGRQDIKLIGVGAGYTYGVQGTSHHAFEDIGIARSIPGLDLYNPGTPREVQLSIGTCAMSPGPAYVRLGWPTVAWEHSPSIDRIDRPIPLGPCRASRVVLATGAVLGQVMAAVRRLADEGAEDVRVVSCPKLAPLDEQELLHMLSGASHVATVENNVAPGGFGEHVARLLLTHRRSPHFRIVAAPMVYYRLARSKEDMEDWAGLSVDQLHRQFRDFFVGR